MKQTLRYLMIILVSGLLFTACKKENEDIVAAPMISDVEVGSGNNAIAYTGDDLHMEAQISAPGNIFSVQLTIHPEGTTGWEFDSTYTAGFEGLKNAEFHKHIDIPASAAVGHYHLHFTVTDQRGQKTEYDREIEIINDPNVPTVTGFEVGLNTAGNDLHMEAAITAPNRIASVTVEIHGPWETSVTYTDAAMVGQTNYNLHKHINVGAAPAGHYHVHLIVKDQSGVEKEFEEHFDK